ncbi:MAG: hypothetical protein EAY70_10620 [Sphingomonadales bacterium]|nr:MAG: hypothetical protein EAY70_10620 [Sphingomonadales bacterium]
MIGAMLGLSLPTVAAAQVACEKCDKMIALNQAEWQCLVERLDTLAKQRSPVVFFTLSERQCPATRQIVVPKGAAMRQAKAIYQFNQRQVQCLKRIASRIPGPDYRVDFETMCSR